MELEDASYEDQARGLCEKLAAGGSEYQADLEALILGDHAEDLLLAVLGQLTVDRLDAYHISAIVRNALEYYVGHMTQDSGRLCRSVQALAQLKIRNIDIAPVATGTIRSDRPTVHADDAEFDEETDKRSVSEWRSMADDIRWRINSAPPVFEYGTQMWGLGDDSSEEPYMDPIGIQFLQSEQRVRDIFREFMDSFDSIKTSQAAAHKLDELAVSVVWVISVPLDAAIEAKKIRAYLLLSAVSIHEFLRKVRELTDKGILFDSQNQSTMVRWTD